MIHSTWMTTYRTRIKIHSSYGVIAQFSIGKLQKICHLSVEWIILHQRSVITWIWCIHLLYHVVEFNEHLGAAPIILTVNLSSRIHFSFWLRWTCKASDQVSGVFVAIGATWTDISCNIYYHATDFDEIDRLPEISQSIVLHNFDQLKTAMCISLSALSNNVNNYINRKQPLQGWQKKRLFSISVLMCCLFTGVRIFLD